MFNNSTCNSTHPDTPDFSYSKILWTTAFSLEFVLAMMGNVFIVWIVFRDNRLKNTTNYLITNMAVSDIIASFSAFPYGIAIVNFENQWMIGGEIGNALCKLTFLTIEMSFAVSAYSCVAIAIDRYYAVAHPFKRLLGCKTVIAVIWIVAAVISSPYLYFLTTIKEGNALYCRVSFKNRSSFLLYGYIFGGFAIFSPVLFITISYTFTICKLYRHKVPGLATSERRRREQQNKKVLKHVVTIVVLLYLSRGFQLTFAMLYYSENLNHLSLSSFLNLVYTSFLIYCLSLMYNFFIYLIFNDIYRENVKALIPKCCRSDDNRRQAIPVGAAVIEIQEMI